MRVLVVNAGSSSLKLRLLDPQDEVLDQADLPAGPTGFDAEAVRTAIEQWPRPDLVGHRVVHGGTRFCSAVLVDDEVRQELAALTDLAPLHQPASLAGLDAVAALLPDVPAVACFDTAFHTTIGPAASTYAVPLEWRDRWGVRRYGFHGLSHAYATRRALELTGRDAPGTRLVTCHLGAGASLCAVLDGTSVDTTMGFTPLEGLVMATRSGSVDPGLVLWLEEHHGLPPQDVASALEQRSGLLGLAGTPDFREVEGRATVGDAVARAALEVYLHRLAGSIAAMAAAAGGIDVLVLTGGVGENSTLLRSAIGERLGWLGVRIDPTANSAGRADLEITGEGAGVRTLVVAAREDRQIAREARALMRS